MALCLSYRWYGLLNPNHPSPLTFRTTTARRAWCVGITRWNQFREGLMVLHIDDSLEPGLKSGLMVESAAMVCCVESQTRLVHVLRAYRHSARSGRQPFHIVPLAVGCYPSHVPRRCSTCSDPFWRWWVGRSLRAAASWLATAPRGHQKSKALVQEQQNLNKPT